MDKYYIGKTIIQNDLSGWKEDEKWWSVNYGAEGKHEVVDYFRAKSRSKKEMQHLLDHVNKQLEEKGTE